MQVQAIQQAVLSWSVRWKEAGYTPEQLKFLIREYAEDLKDEYVSTKEFNYAVRSVRKSCTYFPKMTDILKAVNTYREQPRQISNDQLQIGEHSSLHDMTQEEIEKNRRRIAIAMKVVAKQITPEEGERMQRELNSEGNFSGKMV